MKIAVLGEKDFTLGFELGGIKKVKEINESNYVEAFEEYFSKEDTGIIIMDEKYFKRLPPRLRKKVEKSISPVVIAVSESGAGSSDIQALIKRSLGVDLWKE